MVHQPFIIPAALIFLLAIPLILGRIPPNRGYGIRTPKTLTHPGIWYRANRFGGWALLLSSTIYLLVALLVPTPAPPNDNLLVWLLHLGVFISPLIVSLVLTLSYVKRL
jgi:uncharacterized membrane protein